MNERKMDEKEKRKEIVFREDKNRILKSFVVRCVDKSWLIFVQTETLHSTTLITDNRYRYQRSDR